MLRKTRSRAVSLLALACAALLVFLASAAPLATADHAYSHRYVIYGRVVDSGGEPVSDVRVNVQPELVEINGPCIEEPGDTTEAFGPTRTRLTTNAYGEFIFCVHSHSMARATEGKFHLSAEGSEATVAADPLVRRNFVTLQLDEDRDAGESAAAWANNYTVSGRVWMDTGKTTVEGIRVFGETLNDEPVEVVFKPAGGEPLTVETATNSYGDFSFRLPVPETVESGKVEITVRGETYTYDADLTTRGSDHVIKFEESKAGTIALVFGGIGVIVLMAVGLSGGFGKLKAATKGGRKR